MIDGEMGCVVFSWLDGRRKGAMVVEFACVGKLDGWGGEQERRKTWHLSINC